MPVLATVLLTNVDSIPIPLSFCGGLALVFNFIECPLACNDCPWNANVSSREAKVIGWDSKIRSLIERARPDVIVLLGGEPYESPSALSIATHSKSLGIPVALKVLGRYLTKVMQSNVAKYCDLILVEVVDSCDAQPLSLYRGRDMTMEIVLIAKNCEDAKLKVAALRVESLTPIAIILLDEEPLANQLRLLDSLRRTYPLTCMPLSPSTELASLTCPSCGAYIVLRSSGVLMKKRIQKGRCEFCSFPLRALDSRRVTKVPIAEPLM